MDYEWADALDALTGSTLVIFHLVKTRPECRRKYTALHQCMYS
jgi:hypothetical protein